MGRAWTDEQKKKLSATKKDQVLAGWKPWHASGHLSEEDRLTRSRNRLAKYATGWKPKPKRKIYEVGDVANFKEHGYTTIYLPDHPSSSKQGFVTEHRLKAERAIGRRLTKREQVHHINGDKLDNRNENLLICSVEYHSDLHQRMSYLYQRMIFGKEA